MGRAGNTDRDVRKFLRDLGVKANLSNVELIGKEIRRTASENERVEREAKERGEGLRDPHGPVTHERVSRSVELERRRRNR